VGRKNREGGVFFWCSDNSSSEGKKMRRNTFPTGGKDEKGLLIFLCSLFQKVRSKEAM